MFRSLHKQILSLADGQFGRAGLGTPALSMVAATYGLTGSPTAVFIMPQPAGWDLPISQ